MSLLSYFLQRTNAPDFFKSLTKHTIVDKKKIPNLKINDECHCDSSFELGHKIFFDNSKIMYETFFSNGKYIVRNHLSTHDSKGNLIDLLIYYGDNNKFDNTLDVCYIVDLINDTLGSLNDKELKNFWDEIIVCSDSNCNNNNCNGCNGCNDCNSCNKTTFGYLISKDQSHNPKKIECNGKTICDLLGSDLEICYVDYLKYNGFNVLLYCQKYDIEEFLLNDSCTNNLNKSASDLSKRKIIGHCILVSNDCDINEKHMSQIIVNALNFNKEKYEEMQKKELLRMYAMAHVIQNPKT